MNEASLKAIPKLDQLQILDQDHPASRLLVAQSSANVIAEAIDTFRLFDLLHREEYQPIAAVRFVEADSTKIRVYFHLLDQDQRSNPEGDVRVNRTLQGDFP